MFVTGLVLAAGRSARLGRPKQLLEYRGTTLLGATLTAARSCGFDQLIVTVGGAADEIRARVDLSGCTVVDSVHHTTGCASSILAALGAVDPRADGLVLLLGDQPGIAPSSVRSLFAAASSGAPLAVCRYDDGVGHPFWFARTMFEELRSLHGDKAVWRVLESGRRPVTEVPVDGSNPPDVDTWSDYQRLLGSTA